MRLVATMDYDDTHIVDCILDECKEIIEDFTYRDDNDERSLTVYNKDNNEKNEKQRQFTQFKHWLEEIVKLGQYLDNFINEALDDLNVVKLMQEKDLSDIGVTKKGHRLIFLKHIANLNQQN